MTEPEKTPIQKTQEAELALRRMLLMDQIDENAFSKQALVLASDYADNNAPFEACRLIESLTLTYIEDHLPGQAAADESFAAQLYALSQKIVDLGIVDLTPTYNCTAAPAKA